MGKVRHILFHDGTWQKWSQEHPSNVKLLHDCISPWGKDGAYQRPMYFDGVGSKGSFLQKVWDGVTGSGLEKIIKDSYAYLAHHYKAGDDIVLVGFSRGAFTSRTFNGLLYKCGIPKDTDNLKAHVDQAYDFYKGPVKPRSEEAIAWREKHSIEDRPKVVLACFDTVGSLGAPPQLFILPALLNSRHQFHDTLVNRQTTHAFQASAIDEQRKNFPITPMLPSTDAPTVVEQEWFVGNHTGVGGGVPEDRAFSDIAALRVVEWLERRIGVGFNQDEVAETFIHADVHALSDIDFRQSWFWGIAGWENRPVDFEGLHPTVQDRVDGNSSYRPPGLRKSAAELLRREFL